jgi:2-oxoglutarate dehydrogenase E2 component (dihydrolipoamide succinyltransferase)
MAIEVKVPSPGESISEVEIAGWFVESGDFVEKDQEIGEVESEKATLPLIAEADGQIKLLKEVGDVVPVGEVVCTIDTSVQESKKETDVTEDKAKEDVKAEKEAEVAAEAEKEAKKEQKASSKTDNAILREEKNNKIHEPEAAEKATEKSEGLTTENDKADAKEDKADVKEDHAKATPVARKIMDENGLSIEDVLNGLRKISRRDVERVIGSQKGSGEVSFSTDEASRDEARKTMSNLRKKLSQRLVALKKEPAMLTTFNEADMSRIIELRQKHQSKFVEKHGVKLGYMSFFTKAVSLALKDFPNLNSRIEEDEIITPAYTDIGIAVQTDKGLMVPVVRNTESMDLASIEKAIMELGGKAKKNRISIDDMAGGTFTITNGGIFGSMLSTPILNPPQSGILGMHNIIDRPVALNGQVVIRPMMYLALTYDHRLVDGRDSVSFLVKVKEFIENPEKLLLGGKDTEKLLLGL